MTKVLIVALAGSEIEVTFLFAAILLLLAGRRIPDFARGLRRGLDEFRKAFREVTDEIDLGAGDAGRSVAGIHGKPAAEALTVENQTVEIYDPAAWQERQGVDKVAKVPNGIRAANCRAATKWLAGFAIAGMTLLILVLTVAHYLSKHTSP